MILVCAGSGFYLVSTFVVFEGQAGCSSGLFASSSLLFSCRAVRRGCLVVSDSFIAWMSLLLPVALMLRGAWSSVVSLSLFADC